MTKNLCLDVKRRLLRSLYKLLKRYAMNWISGFIFALELSSCVSKKKFALTTLHKPYHEMLFGHCLLTPPT